MISKAADVDTYMAELPEERRAVMTRLRGLCRKYFAGYDEVIEYGMPAYKKAGEIGFSFASQKQYVALYGLSKVVSEDQRKALVGADLGKGCLRFKKPEKMDFAVIEELLRKKAEMGGVSC